MISNKDKTYSLHILTFILSSTDRNQKLEHNIMIEKV